MFNALGNFPAAKNTASGLLNSYGGASAAYSLQRLNSSTANVIRARRSVDNAEQDFAATDIGDPLRQFAMNGSAELLGFAKAGNRMYFDGVNDYVVLANYGSAGRIKLKMVMLGAQSSGTKLAGNRTTPSSDVVAMLFNDAGGQKIAVQLNDSVNVVESSTLNTYQEYTVELAWGSGTCELFIDSVSQGTDTYTGSITAKNIVLGWYAGGYFNGLIYDVDLYSDAAGTTLVNSYNGYGNSASDWEDQTGSDDGTVNGSPALFTGQGFDAYVTTWYDQSGILGEPLSTFARHATSATTRMEFDGSDDYIDSGVKAPGGSAVALSWKMLLRDTSNQGIISCGGHTGSAKGFTIRTAGNSINILRSDGTTAVITGNFVGFVVSDNLDEILDCSFAWDGGTSTPTLTINGTIYNYSETVSGWTGDSTQNVVMGAYNGGALALMEGLIYDVTYSGLFSYQGYGNTDSDWEDQLGSNDGTVNGSPSIYEGRNATQSTAASQPQIIADGVVTTDTEGNPTLEFDGSDYLTMGGLAVSETTAFVVGDNATGEEAYYQVGTLNQISSVFTQGGNLYGRSSSPTRDLTSSVPAGGIKLFTHLSLDTRSELWLDGTSLDSDETDLSLITSSTGTIGGLNSSIYLLNGNMGELVIYGSDQSSNRAAIEAEIAARYSITLS